MRRGRGSWRPVLALLALVGGCSRPGVETSPPASTATAAPPTSASPSPLPPGPCGIGPKDWCPSPPGDRCGAHKDEASCRADKGCQGVQYRGESVVTCMPDGNGFWTNCPAVGCVSR